MVIDLLRLNLENLFNFYDRKFTLKTIFLFADELIRRIKEVHCQPYFLSRITFNSLTISYIKRGNQVYLFKLSHVYVLKTDGKVLTSTAYDPLIDGPLEVSKCYINPCYHLALTCQNRLVAMI
jgi:hypothetical protein